MDGKPPQRLFIPSTPSTSSSSDQSGSNTFPDMSHSVLLEPPMAAPFPISSSQSFEQQPIGASLQAFPQSAMPFDLAQDSQQWQNPRQYYIQQQLLQQQQQQQQFHQQHQQQLLQNPHRSYQMENVAPHQAFQTISPSSSSSTGADYHPIGASQQGHGGLFPVYQNHHNQQHNQKNHHQRVHHHQAFPAAPVRLEPVNAQGQMIQDPTRGGSLSASSSLSSNAVYGTVPLSVPDQQSSSTVPFDRVSFQSSSVNNSPTTPIHPFSPPDQVSSNPGSDFTSPFTKQSSSAAARPTSPSTTASSSTSTSASGSSITKAKAEEANLTTITKGNVKAKEFLRSFRLRGITSNEGEAACDFCRKRKIKCDREKPVCSACRERKLECKTSDVLRKRGPPTRAERLHLAEAGFKYNPDERKGRRRIRSTAEHKEPATAELAAAGLVTSDPLSEGSSRRGSYEQTMSRRGSHPYLELGQGSFETLSLPVSPMARISMGLAQARGLGPTDAEHSSSSSSPAIGSMPQDWASTTMHLSLPATAAHEKEYTSSGQSPNPSYRQPR